MNQRWVPIAIFVSLGVIMPLVYGMVSIANSIDYEVLSYQVQYLDSKGVTFRVQFAITNPSGSNLEVWGQRYDIYVAGYKVSEVTSQERYKLLADNTSVIPLDVHLKWQDVEDKIAPMISQSSVTELGDLPVLIKGKLAAKLGILKIPYLPIRTTMRLANFLP